jgi:hypothetical protein
MKQIFFYLLMIFSVHQITAQNNTGKVIDSKTGESIPYANIVVDNTKSLISNADGFFSVSENNTDESSILEVSYLGYVNSRMTLAQLKNQQNIIRLEPGILELNDVDVSNSKPDAYSIITTVKKNLEQNYKSQYDASKEVLFYRESNFFKPEKFDMEITKSTGLTKNNLKLANTELNTFISNLIVHPPKEFTDLLCNYYMNPKIDKDKSVILTKMEVLKATKLTDEYQSANVDDLEQTASKLLLKYLDSTKYYRVKSGLFGSRDSVSLRKDFYKNKKNRDKRTKIVTANSSLRTFMSKNNFLLNNKLDFVTQPEIYEYHYEGATYSNNNEFVYILTFKPKKNKAKYTGKLYISETDYGVIRADFTLAQGKTVREFNMKLLLGIKSAENVSKGTLLFNRNPNGIGYYLRYASRDKGVSFYVNRPLKFIELSDGEKDVLALDIKLEGSGLNKREVLNISHTEITDTAYSQAVEKNIKPIKLNKYDPSIWKGIGTIEPLEEMKQFKTAE